MAVTEVLLLLLGLVLLVKGADYFVKSAAHIAKALGISEFLIGLTLVALGTSIPELASSIVASLNNSTGLIIGNVIGSNIANIGLIAGIVAVLSIIKTKENMLKRDGYIMLFVSFVFLLFAFNGVIEFYEALIFLVLYIVYVLFLIDVESKEKEFHFPQFLNYFLTFKYVGTVKNMFSSSGSKKSFDHSLFKQFFIVIVSVGAIVLGAHFFITEAIFFATLFGLSDTFIGLTLVAIGTSLPELVVSGSAALRGYGNIAIGNIIGSNISNILLILGVTGIMSPLNVVRSSLFFTIPFMIMMSVILLMFIKSDWELRKAEGIIFLVLYVLFIGVLALFTF